MPNIFKYDLLREWCKLNCAPAQLHAPQRNASSPCAFKYMHTCVWIHRALLRISRARSFSLSLSLSLAHSLSRSLFLARSLARARALSFSLLIPASESDEISWRSSESDEISWRSFIDYKADFWEFLPDKDMPLTIQDDDDVSYMKRFTI